METLKDLQNQLAKLRQDNSKAWETYGSELCAGEMTAKEEALELKIKEYEQRT